MDSKTQRRVLYGGAVALAGIVLLSRRGAQAGNQGASGAGPQYGYRTVTTPGYYYGGGSGGYSTPGTPGTPARQTAYTTQTYSSGNNARVARYNAAARYSNEALSRGQQLIQGLTDQPRVTATAPTPNPLFPLRTSNPTPGGYGLPYSQGGSQTDNYAGGTFTTPGYQMVTPNLLVYQPQHTQAHVTVTEYDGLGQTAPTKYYDYRGNEIPAPAYVTAPDISVFGADVGPIYDNTGSIDLTGGDTAAAPSIPVFRYLNYTQPQVYIRQQPAYVAPAAPAYVAPAAPAYVAPTRAYVPLPQYVQAPTIAPAYTPQVQNYAAPPALPTYSPPPDAYEGGHVGPAGYYDWNGIYWAWYAPPKWVAAYEAGQASNPNNGSYSTYGGYLTGSNFGTRWGGDAGGSGGDGSGGGGAGGYTAGENIHQAGTQGGSAQ